VGRQWQTASEPEQLRRAGAGFRGELQEYHRVATESLAILRKEVEAAAAAITAFASGIASHTEDHEEQLNRELDRLASAAQTNDVVQMRGAIQTAISQIHAAVEQMRLANQMVAAQMQDEIRALHQQIKTGGSRDTNPPRRLRTRAQMEQKISRALLSRQPFCLLLIAVSDWNSEVRQSTSDGAATLMEAMITRLHDAIDPDLVVGEWGDSELITVLGVDPATAISISREATAALSGSYQIESRTMELKVKAGVIDRASGTESPEFRTKLSALSEALARA
jgi:GGDEF domain-containing protein